MSWDYDDRLPEDLMRPPAREPDEWDDGIPTNCHECGGGTTYSTLALFGQCWHCENDQRKRQRACCSHVWIDLEDPPIARAPYSPVIGPGRREMKRGRRYVCRNCGLALTPTTHGDIERARQGPPLLDED